MRAYILNHEQEAQSLNWEWRETPSGMLPPTKPQALNLPKQPNSSITREPSRQMPKSMGGIPFKPSHPQIPGTVYVVPYNPHSVFVIGTKPNSHGGFIPGQKL